MCGCRYIENCVIVKALSFNVIHDLTIYIVQNSGLTTSTSAQAILL